MNRQGFGDLRKRKSPNTDIENYGPSVGDLKANDEQSFKFTLKQLNKGPHEEASIEADLAYRS